MTSDDYARRFHDPDDVRNYEQLYSAESYDSFIWRLQQPIVQDVAKGLLRLGRPLRVLDFACGTGRITEVLRPYADQLDGVDVSSEMVARAQERVPGAQFSLGDITSDPELAPGPYHLITAFRFLLNTPPATRTQVLKALSRRLDPVAGLLLVNNHGNRHSLRHFAIRGKAARDVLANELSRRELTEALDNAGLNVASSWGFGIFPSGFHRGPLRRFARALESRVACKRPLAPVSVDVLYLIRPRRSN